MKYLNKKLRRDVLKNWTQFFSVFLMSFLSILVFVGLQGAWGGLEKSLDQFISSANLADSWIYSTGVTDETIKEIKKIDGIKQVTEKTRLNVIDPRDTKKEKYLSLDTYRENNLSQATIVEGTAISSDLKESIWLNKEYAADNNIKVGDAFKVEFNNKETTLTVKGLIQSAEKIYFTGSQEFIAPNYTDYGYGLISEDTLHDSFEYLGQPNILELKATDRDFRQEIEDILGNKFIAYYNRQSLNEVANALDRVEQIQNLSYMFSFVFILLAILAMYTTIRRLIESQTKEIAVIKALGFSNRQIGLHYVSFGFLVGGLGVLFGAMGSPFLSWFVLGTQKDMFSIPEWVISYNYLSLLVCLLVISICALSAFFASREARIGLPAIFLRGESMKKVHHIFIEKIPFIWHKLNYASRWAFRDVAINRVRMLMGIIGVAGGMMLLVAGFGMPDSINHLMNKAYQEDFTYDKRLSTTNIDELLEDFSGQSVQILPTRFTPDDGFNRLLIIISEGSYVNMKTSDGQRIKDDGIYLTNGFAKRGNIEKGDYVSVRPSLDDKEYRFEVKGIISSETNQGAYIMQKKWEEKGGDFAPQTLLTGEKVSLEKASDNPKVASIIQITEQKENAREFVASLMSIFMMIIGFAILLVVVVLYNLGTLNFVERTRDYATLRVIGFHKNELRKITMIENIVTTSIGWVIGIPLGLWFLDQYVKTFSTIYLEYTLYISLVNLIAASAVVWLCSLTTTFFIGRRIQKLDMVEALKGVD